MAEFHFFFIEQDEIELIEFILTQLKLKIIPNINYDEPKYIIIKDIITYRKYRNMEHYGFKVGSFCLFGDNFYKYHLEMRKIEGGAADGKYFIMPHAGGPVIDIRFRPIRIEGSERVVAPGEVTHHHKYWDPMEQEIKVPEELKKTYKEIIKSIKKNAFPCIPVVRERIWAGKHATKEFFEGKLKLKWYEKTYYTPILK